MAKYVAALLLAIVALAAVAPVADGEFVALLTWLLLSLCH
jgi:hypothetical protein